MSTAGRTELLIDNSDSGYDPMSGSGTLLLVSVRDDEDQTRSREGLAQEAPEIKVNSVQEFCRKTGVRIVGHIKDPQDRDQLVQIPVRDESTFTEGGMTRACPLLMSFYVAQRTNEDIAQHDPGEGPLTDEEIAYLDGTLEFLDRATQEVEHDDVD